MRAWIRWIGVIECVIGLGTLLGVGFSLAVHTSEKSIGVLVFVLMAALVSLAIGAGLLLFKESARTWVLYFSGYIVLEKLMIFLGVLTLNGHIVSDRYGIPTDYVSLVYHLFLLYFLSRSPVRLFFK